jgi:hypothetical protein
MRDIHNCLFPKIFRAEVSCRKKRTVLIICYGSKAEALLEAPASDKEPRVPRYFFHVIDGRSSPDLEGYECADIRVAQDEAIRMSGQIMRDRGSHFWDGSEWRMEVTAGERNLFVVRFSAEELP